MVVNFFMNARRAGLLLFFFQMQTMSKGFSTFVGKYFNLPGLLSVMLLSRNATPPVSSR